jgi:hypothetical protein
MRTELVLASYNADESDWRETEELKNTESPHYVGKAAVALSCDSDVIKKTGKVLKVSDLAKEYGFADIDGSRPAAFHLDP